MAKLKKSNIKKVICPTCKGNGFVKVGTEWGETIAQCWDCDSEGEFYVHKSPALKPDLYVDTVTGNVNKLH